MEQSFLDHNLHHVIISRYEGDMSGQCHVWYDGGRSYTGNLLHGKRNGKGLLIWPNKTQYAGDFLNDAIVGQGTYTWVDGSTYQGGVAHGLREGHGIYKCGGKTYCGEWTKGKRHGKGILYFDSSEESYYDGEWCKDIQCGFGKRSFRNGSIYEGHFKDNLRDGEGTMSWYEQNQKYTGTWRKGVQNGKGEYTWYFERVLNSQYPLRNHYIGEFKDGMRHGKGKFFYANGSVFDGQWKEDMKHGAGTFIFKNGSIFAGDFCEDHMLAFPDLKLLQIRTPNITEGIVNPSKQSCAILNDGGVIDAFLDSDVCELLKESTNSAEKLQQEICKIRNSILQFSTELKLIYKVYSCLGVEQSPDNTYVMNLLQFCRFCKDCYLHCFGFSFCEIANCLGIGQPLNHINQEVFMKDFLNYLIKISHFLFDDDNMSTSFNRLLLFIVQKKSNDVKGFGFTTSRRATEVFKYKDVCADIYSYYSHSFYKCLTKHDILLMCKTMKLVNEHLTSRKLIAILSAEEDKDSTLNITDKVGVMEFIEFLVGCCSVDDEKEGELMSRSHEIKEEDGGHRFSEKHEDVVTWTRKLTTFMSERLLPVFEQQKIVDKILFKASNMYNMK